MTQRVLQFILFRNYLEKHFSTRNWVNLLDFRIFWSIKQQLNDYHTNTGNNRGRQRANCRKGASNGSGFEEEINVVSLVSFVQEKRLKQVQLGWAQKGRWRKDIHPAMVVSTMRSPRSGTSVFI